MVVSFLVCIRALIWGLGACVISSLGKTHFLAYVFRQFQRKTDLHESNFLHEFWLATHWKQTYLKSCWTQRNSKDSRLFFLAQTCKSQLLLLLTWGSVSVVCDLWSSNALVNMPCSKSILCRLKEFFYVY